MWRPSLVRTGGMCARAGTWGRRATGARDYNQPPAPSNLSTVVPRRAKRSLSTVANSCARRFTCALEGNVRDLRSSLSSGTVPRLGFLCLLCCLNRTRLLSRRPFSPHGVDCESEMCTGAKADATTSTKPGFCTACTHRPLCDCRCICTA